MNTSLLGVKMSKEATVTFMEAAPVYSTQSIDVCFHNANLWYVYA